MSQSAQVCLDSRQRVSALVTTMAGMVEGAIDQSMQALLAGDGRLAEAVLQKETVVNCMEMHIDAVVLGHLAHKNAPVEDIRSMALALKINKGLERMGDLAANIGRKVVALGQTWEESKRFELQPMAIAVSHICRKTLRALIRRDIVLARSVAGSLEAVHTYRDYVLRCIKERLSQGGSEIDSDLALLLASRHMEQIAVYAANLAENLVFWLQTSPKNELLAG